MRAVAVFVAISKNWLRSRSGLFFSFLFPVILLLLFASAFANGAQSSPFSSPNGQADYYMPGLIAAFVMANGVIGITNVAGEFKRSGLMKRLSATPLTKLDWMVGTVLSQAVLGFLLAGFMIALGVAIYRSPVLLNPYSLGLLVSGSVLFAGIGMTLAGLVRDPEAASGLGNLIAFPMMFLSGTFWAVNAMPVLLQYVAYALPLTYFSEGLRGSLLPGSDPASVALDLGVTTAFALAFILIGAKSTRWTEE